MLRIANITQMNIEGSRAHVHNTLKTCEALQRAGGNVSLIFSDVPPGDLAVIFRRHGITVPFSCHFLGSVTTLEQFHASRIRRLVAFVRLNLSLALYLWKNRHQFDAVYYRNHLLLFPALVWRSFVRKPVFFESHYVYIFKAIPQFVTSLSIKTARGVVAITKALKDFYHLSDQACIVAPCHAVELELVPTDDSSALRRELDLPQSKTILCYTGSLGATIQGISYEVETMVDVLASLSDTYVSLIVGEREGTNDANQLMERASKIGVADRIIIRPWCDRIKLMRYLRAADILLMPRVGTAPGSSPSKMFDYLAVNKPIIAAATPPVEEILINEHNALLVNADRPEEWVNAVHQLNQNKELQAHLIDGAHVDAERYTWMERGRRILAFLQARSS